MQKYSDLTIISMRKGDLLRYIRNLEDIIEKFDKEINRQHNIISNAIEYISSHTYNEKAKKNSYDLGNREVKELMQLLKGEGNEQ